ncbi:MAG: leucine--tRNA ligase [Gammaproteobacteria bacterium]
MNPHYQPEHIEPAVQAFWDTDKTFQVKEDSHREKFYCLSMLPYPSGHLHMGHVRNYTIGDVIARFERMNGKNVLQPMGWDAFGLPAENAAIKNGSAPSQWTYENIAHMRNQLQKLGFAYDWSREIATCDPHYYRWEQWLFLQMYKKGLVYKKSTLVNWDPVDQTVLANEQVINGRGWRSDALVELREIPQWFFKITDYAEELLTELAQMPGWPEQVRTMQKNWIGRSVGHRVFFKLQNSEATLEVYTTRLDTLSGVTYLAIAAQHPLAHLAGENNAEVKAFIDECAHGKTAEAELAQMEKRGIFTGLYAHHPITNELLPIWIANFVLMNYGSGAVMAVPIQDERDAAFAEKYQLPVKEITDSVDESAFEQQVNFRLRDWGISRQRYWGAPIPMINCETCGPQPVKEEDLPVVLPEGLIPSEKGSVLKEHAEFLKAKCPNCGEPATRESDTFDTFMESSWYFARYTCPDQDKKILDERALYWLPVDYYIGGIEHAVMHLLYSRFIYKVLRDLNLVPGDEPFKNLLTQGMVLKDGAKMSKSKGNTVDPNVLINTYGADTVRLFSMFAAPPELSLEWSDAGVEGASRYLKRLYKLVHTHLQNPIQGESVKDLNANQQELRYQIHFTIKKVTEDIQVRKIFNTAIASIMELTNFLHKYTVNDATDYALMQRALETIVLLLAPITPHVCHFLWQQLGNEGTVALHPWPAFDNSFLSRAQYELVVQVNGKVRAKLQIAEGTDEEAIKQQALQEDNVQKFIAGKDIKKIIIVPKRLVSIVI